MNDKEFIIFGVKQRPPEVYRTCTFQGLGSRRDEFLDDVVKAMGKRGLKNVPPIEPFDLSVGTKELFRIWDWSEFTEMSKFYIAGSDLLLLGEKTKGVTYPKGITIKADVRGEDLRFGYVLLKELFKIASIKGLIFLLQLFTGIGLMALGMLLIKNTFGGSLGSLGVLILSLVTVVPLWLLYFLYHPVIKPKRRQKEIDKTITEIAESMGGKRITPFKKTTVKLED